MMCGHVFLLAMLGFPLSHVIVAMCLGVLVSVAMRERNSCRLPRLWMNNQ